MKKRITILLFIGLMGVWITGCVSQPQPPNQAEETADQNVTLVLYYCDREAMDLLSEERTITLPPGKHIVQAALEELGNEPSQPNAIAMLPTGTEVLDITVADGIVTINFNSALNTNFIGGSAGEALLIDSIVNTVTSIDEYSGYGVQFLINSEVVDSIGGHIDASQPFFPHN